MIYSQIIFMLRSFIGIFDKGEYIIREGEEGNTFFIIAKGEVCFTALRVQQG